MPDKITIARIYMAAALALLLTTLLRFGSNDWGIFLLLSLYAIDKAHYWAKGRHLAHAQREDFSDRHPRQAQNAKQADRMTGLLLGSER